MDFSWNHHFHKPKERAGGPARTLEFPQLHVEKTVVSAQLQTTDNFVAIIANQMLLQGTQISERLPMGWKASLFVVKCVQLVSVAAFAPLLSTWLQPKCMSRSDVCRP